jgi:ubiquinone/menaquinone biosynthesis C-methylase UbiE
MVPDCDELFAHRAEKYDRFVAAEDFQGNLLRTVMQLSQLDSAQVVTDLGTGTGRVAYLIAPHVRHVYGIEPVSGMRQVAEAKKHERGINNVDFLAGEHKAIPLPDSSVDLIIEGWAYLKAFVFTYPSWRPEFDAIVPEMRRILRPGKGVILIETMGSLHLWKEIPARTAVLYDYFEKERRLRRVTIRADYRFSSLAEAVDLGTFFFGDEAGAEIRRLGDCVVPEATAIWHGTI